MSQYDLGVGSTPGLDIQGATEELLRSAYSSHTTCYVCKHNTPQYQVIAKKDKYITAEIQNGLYLCGHCIQLKPINSKQYGIKELQ